MKFDDLDNSTAAYAEYLEHNNVTSVILAYDKKEGNLVTQYYGDDNDLINLIATEFVSNELFRQAIMKIITSSLDGLKQVLNINNLNKDIIENIEEDYDEEDEE